MTLHITDLSVRIPLPDGDVVEAVRNASLVALRNRVHYIVGGSGSGKSTLLDAVSGLLPDAAIVSGEITTGDPQRVLGRDIGVVPQSPTTSFTPIRRLGSQLSEVVRYLDGKRTPEELLELVELEPDVLRRYPFELSGGMAQRAAIATALAGDPAILIADEPTASLDPHLALAVLTMLTNLAETGRVVVVATHDIAAVRKAAVDGEADVSVMCDAHIVERGSIRRVFDDPTHTYTQNLLAASNFRLGAAR
ncbi:putative ABC transporter ATP-binding protein [Gordonia effusa NBRC 100432]|uniref:Putative ABC transporter ATP-binding protein n=1 Tax=Gordonia effusa NBRC 100432 TaxID=1077974 RepID=H0R6I0_9ACTN|nr:ATP-binding cassette domain-containing protein [Gordonia effusa]GAB20681.1 putative ABC transporter ATP-binding protein [Gordonia effusa NBRC 100432]